MENWELLSPWKIFGMDVGYTKIEMKFPKQISIPVMHEID